MRPPEGPAGAEIRPREGMIAGPGSSGRREGPAVYLLRLCMIFSENRYPLFGVMHFRYIAWRAGRSVGENRSPPRRAGEAHAPLDGAFAQQRGRIVPERLGERVAQICAGDADIGQHVAVEAGEHGGLALVLAGARA